MEIIPYTPSVKVLNAEALSKCKGAKFLECIRAHTGELIAKQWRRVQPVKFDVLIKFGN